MKRKNFPGRVKQRREGARHRLRMQIAGHGRYKFAEPLTVSEIARIEREITTLDARIGSAP